VPARDPGKAAQLEKPLSIPKVRYFASKTKLLGSKAKLPENAGREKAQSVYLL